MKKVGLPNLPEVSEQDKILLDEKLKLFPLNSKLKVDNILSNNYINENEHGLESYEEKILKSRMISFLNNNGIEYLEDLERLKVREFLKLISINKDICDFISDLGIKRKGLLKPHMIEIGLEIGLERKKIDYNYIIGFLRKNGIRNYCHFRDLDDKCWLAEARTLLWGDDVCKSVLQGLGLEYSEGLLLEYSKDFREYHLRRFCRKVGIPGVPREIEKNESDTIDKIKRRLLINGVGDRYCLYLKGIKFFKNVFKEGNIGKILYVEVNNYIKEKVGVNIPVLRSPNLEEISELLGLPELSDKEHKERLLVFLDQEGKELDTLTKNNIKLGYWHNPHFRYFLAKQGLTDLKELRLEHVNEMKRCIKRI